MALRWAVERYGDPCRECGYRWSSSVDDAMEIVAGASHRYGSLLRGLDGSQRDPDLAWPAVGYVCHVGDNLRIWAERLAGALDGCSRPIRPYDADLLARARAYDSVPLAGALWSLDRAASEWREVMVKARAADLWLTHPDRGRQSAEEVAMSNGHDTHHHEWDLRRITDHARRP